jgi:excisionase family DNA binding protein
MSAGTKTPLPPGRYALLVSENGSLYVEPTSEAEPTLTINEAAAWLKTSVRNIRAYVSRKQKPMPCFKMGRELRFDRTSVKQWLQNESLLARRLSHIEQ